MSVDGALRFEATGAGQQADLASLFAAIAADPKAKYFHPHPLDAAEAGRRAAYAGKDYYCLAYLDGVPAAYGMLRGWDEGYAEPSLGLAVAPAFQGRGLGRALTEHLHEVARARGATTVRLKVYAENAGARALYAKLGYAFETSKPGEELGRLRIAWPRRIGILTQGLVEWNGGVDFVFGVVRALLAAPSAADAEFHVLLPSLPPRFWSKAFLKSLEQRAKGVFQRQDPLQARRKTMEALGRRLAELGPRVRLHAIAADAAAHRQAAQALKLEAVVPAMRPLDLGPDCGGVGYVYDFQHVHFPHLFKAKDRDRRDRMFAETMAASKAVIVNARTIAEELRTRHPASPARVFALPFAPSPQPDWLVDRPDVASSYRPTGRYFIVSNQFWTHKNHRTAFRAFSRLRANHPDVTLVCTGDTHDNRDPSYYPGLLAELDQAGVREAVHILGLIPKRAQIELLKGAVALVQPTLYEGGPGGGAAFDAIALDVPVLASDIPVNREIDCGDVRYFAPTDDEGLARLMAEALGKTTVRRSPEALLAAGQAKIAAAGEVLWAALLASGTALGTRKESLSSAPLPRAGSPPSSLPARRSLSVVMPTFNCAYLMERHLAGMAAWADLADEIIVVDSRSTDGTLDLIRSRLRHPSIRIIERDRGLYESWNEGIAATSGDWVYISTAGDTIERAHLLHLLELGERAAADVVISAPRFVDETGQAGHDLGWPPQKVVAASGRDVPFLLTAEAAFVLAYVHCPSAILGSSASDLYRGTHLRARPFPVDFKGAGDSVWILRHAAESRLCFTPQVGSTFCVHPKEEELRDGRLAGLVEKILAEKQATLGRPGVDGELVRALAAESRLFGEVQSLHRDRRRLWHARPGSAANLWRWSGLTLAYLRKRGQLRALRRRILGQFLPDSCYLPVRAKSP